MSDERLRRLDRQLSQEPGNLELRLQTGLMKKNSLGVLEGSGRLFGHDEAVYGYAPPGPGVVVRDLCLTPCERGSQWFAAVALEPHGWVASRARNDAPAWDVLAAEGNPLLVALGRKWHMPGEGGDDAWAKPYFEARKRAGLPYAFLDPHDASGEDLWYGLHSALGSELLRALDYHYYLGWPRRDPRLQAVLDHLVSWSRAEGRPCQRCEECRAGIRCRELPPYSQYPPPGPRMGWLHVGDLVLENVEQEGVEEYWGGELEMEGVPFQALRRLVGRAVQVLSVTHPEREP